MLNKNAVGEVEKRKIFKIFASALDKSKNGYILRNTIRKDMF